MLQGLKSRIKRVEEKLGIHKVVLLWPEEVITPELEKKIKEVEKIEGIEIHIWCWLGDDGKPLLSGHSKDDPNYVKGLGWLLYHTPRHREKLQKIC